MDTLQQTLTLLYSSEGLFQLIQTVGLLGLCAIVFAETGLFLGFFLPGDSLLVTAGILASPQAIGGGIFEPVSLAVALVGAAILGNQVNYFLGKKTGDMVFSRPDGRFIKQRYFHEAKAFYQKHGGSAIVLARFVPILRTFVPFIAGVGQMPQKNYALYNMLGALLWVPSLVAIGYFIGQTPLAQKLHHVILVVVVISLLPLFFAGAKKFLITAKGKKSF